MILNRCLTLLIASATLHQVCTAQRARRLPTSIDQGFSPAGVSLNKRNVCSEGRECFIGNCCGDKCADNCCALDNGGVGCSLTESCSFEGNVFIGCCDNQAIGECSGTPTRITIHTPYSTVTFSSAGEETTTMDTTPTSSAEQTFTLPTVDSSTSVEQTFTLPTVKSSSPTVSATTSSTTMMDTSSTVATTATNTGTSSSKGPATATTSEGAAPIVASSLPGGVKLGALAILGAWIAL